MNDSTCPICGESLFICRDLNSPTLTINEVRQAFKSYGLTIAQWAERHGVHKASVYQVLYRKHRSYHGKAHAIAVLLRLKNGDINEFINARCAEQRASQIAQ